MTLKHRFTVTAGKFVSWTSKTFRLGAGATWPGEIALMMSPHILGEFGTHITNGIILVAGTNGKTTTSLMIKTILEKDGKSVVHNKSGANLLNGVVSACIEHTSRGGRVNGDYGVFEIDENSLPIVMRYIVPKFIVILNLFRDQLDRYGEVDVIAEKWQKALRTVDERTTLILNADDPLVASFANNVKANVKYFGLNDPALASPKMEHATDSIFCLFCGARLSYKVNYFSHIGEWFCSVCGEARPKLDLSDWSSPLPGLYNRYNTLAAVLTAKECHIPDDHITNALTGFAPAFGRQEEFVVTDKKIKVFLSKNPAGFNASLRTVLESKPAALLLALNDRIPDGRDVSWIWDVDFETVPKNVGVVVTGDRVYDMAIRMQYSGGEMRKPQIEPDLSHAIKEGLALTPQGGILYVLSTYSAMLEVRKIVGGRKIL